MIRLSKLPFKTLKTIPNVSDNKSTWILLQAWFIRQVMAWVYTYTTLWLRVLNNIEKIVREELDNYWCFETYMPWLSPKELWDKTWRWEIDDYFKVDAHWDKQYRLNPTHEELVVPLMQDFINSYKDSNTCVYQIKDKYRNEKRAKSWLLRWRDFIMKDAYSFHYSNEDFEKYYEWMKKVYMKIFDRLWLWKDTYITIADWWVFTEKHSHEFQVILSIWEDEIYICKNCWLSHNKEIIDKENGFKCKNCNSNECIIEKASEVWNIFPLETKYTNAFQMKFNDENNNEQDVIMWCYGIWISRLMWVIAEYNLQENTIKWPSNIAPADYYIIVIWEENINIAESISKKLESEWKTVILDDRMNKKIWFWQKARDCELFWIPNRIVISQKTIENWGYEIKEEWKEVTIKNF